MQDPLFILAIGILFVVGGTMAFLALKLNNIRRYSCDDLWCLDRGSGLFAGLSVLPKNAWFSSYSHRVTREANLAFLERTSPDLERQWASLRHNEP